MTAIFSSCWSAWPSEAPLVYLWARERLGRASDKLAAVEQGQGQWEDRAQGRHRRRAPEEPGVAARAHRGEARADQGDAEQVRAADEAARGAAPARGLEDRRAASRFVAEGQEKLRTETGSLVTALRAPHVRGRWGELQLKRVVELAGMLDHCDFLLQESERDDEGHLLRPDMVVKLAGGKRIVVDSKVPIHGVPRRASTPTTSKLKRAHLARHAQQVRDHIKKLGQKRYWDQFESTPEFVVMFVDEGLYRAALDQDGSLIETGAVAR